MLSFFRSWTRVLGPQEPRIYHENSDSIHLETIPDSTFFFRKGSGLTLITGAVGKKVNMTVQGNSSLRITGNIGSGCKILKEGNGSLTIEGVVADDLELTVYGQGVITFTQRPPRQVINLIKNRGAAQFICEGEPLELPSQGYRRHNLGVPRDDVPEQSEQTRALRQLSNNRPPAPAAQLENTEDKHTQLTLDYINQFKDHRTIADRINELNLTEEELPLFQPFEDYIMKDYFTDIPVMYDERYYNYGWLLNWYEHKKTDPASRKPMTLGGFYSARGKYDDLDNAIIELNKKRATAKQTTSDHHDTDVAELSTLSM